MRNKLLYGFLTVMVLLYAVSIFVFKTDSAALAKYHVSDTELRLLSLVFVLPTFVIWYVAVYSLVKISSYAARIKKTKDGKGMHLLAWGLGALAAGTIMNTVVSRMLNYAVSEDMISRSMSTIITTHVGVTYIFVSFLLLFLGSRQLLKTIKKPDISPTKYLWVTVAMLAISVPYVFAVLTNPSRTVATGTSRVATYAMPDWLILTTLVIPYLIAWALGFYAVIFMGAYQKHVGGLLYKKALNKLTKGFFLTIVLTIVLQFISAISPIILGWVLTAILLLLVVLLGMIVIGYIYIARGAKGLSKLEEVT